MGTSEMALLSLFPLGFCLRQSSRTIKICQAPAWQGTRLTAEAGICTMDRVVPQHFPSPGIFCTGGNISQCQWLILEYINCLRKWTCITQMTNPDKWQKLLISVHSCSKWLQNYRFEVGTGCQSSPACVNAHQTQPEYPFLPFITV